MEGGGGGVSDEMKKRDKGERHMNNRKLTLAIMRFIVNTSNSSLQTSFWLTSNSSFNLFE